jgi:colanic acid biosynthesis glycosyl transferase WcaI
MHILLISMFYSPEPVARPHDLARILQQSGHCVCVITAYPNYPEGKVYQNYKPRFAQWEEIDGIMVLRVPHLLDRSRSAIRRILSYTSFSISAVLFGLLRTEKPDVIWTYQIGLPGVMLCKLWHVPMVHEVGDLWPDWGRAANLGIRAGLYRLLELEERFIYRSAKTIVTITKGLKNELVRKGVNPGKIEIIPNWANDEVFHPMNPDPVLASKEGFVGFFNVVYIGNVGVAQALGIILEAADKLRDIPELHFVIIGDGVERKELEERSQIMGLNNVRFLGSRPQNEVADYMAISDLLFIHLKRDRIFDITIPSKTYGYLASGRPILAAAEGELAELINRLGAGFVCPPEDPETLAIVIKNILKMPADKINQMGKAGHHEVFTRFSRSSLGEQYSTIFNDAIKSFQEDKN